jgi:hypothetical protein
VFDENPSWFDTAVSFWRDRVPAYMYLSSDGPTPHRPLVPNKCTQFTPNRFRVRTKYGGEAPKGIKVGPTGGNTFSMEVAYNEFHNRLGIPMPQTALQLAKVRPTGNDTHFLEWETLTDANVGWTGIPSPPAPPGA